MIPTQRVSSYLQRQFVDRVINLSYLNETVLFQIFKEDSSQAVFSRVSLLTLSCVDISNFHKMFRTFTFMILKNQWLSRI